MILLPERFRRMPWANGLGVTVEILRIDGPDGLLLRLSRAKVVGVGPFSLFPGTERNLTVLSGPGFDLEGEGIALAARPLVPVAFPGDVPLRAERVTGPSEDFNVMTARTLPRPVARVLQEGAELEAEWVFGYALAATRIAGEDLPEGALFAGRNRLVCDTRGPVLAVGVAGLPAGSLDRLMVQ